ncbi:cupin-like domain-containing protein [Arenicella xantha]|uniref:Cupin-like protein n=1 Tax=Arenicella xantha TaxID=644221 RepID=A0A395JPF4_9GAMM|nr:cupin-like domain-containing protein [Arenicella xantha]RBP51677.1 cupin-like protein [Arenicella xantha]
MSKSTNNNEPLSSASLPAVTEYSDASVDTLIEQILPAGQPAVLRGFAAEWPAVHEAVKGPDNAYKYLHDRAQPHATELYSLDKKWRGELTYTEDLQDVTFSAVAADFGTALKQIFDASLHGDADYYCGSVEAHKALKNFTEHNRFPWLDKSIVPRIWLGNDIEVATHYDVSDNLACVIAGRRRFTLFPPEQIANLYIGPIDYTLAGRPASLVSLRQPDLDKYPRFKTAMQHAVVAELGPGDVLFIPSLWWHHVASSGGFNVLLNYWWANSRFGGNAAYEAMIHGLMTVSALPPEQRLAWRAFFDHYVFRPDGDPAEHIPEHRHGVLGKMIPARYAKIKQYLYKSMRLK